MLYLPEKLEKLIKDTFVVIKIKRNTGILEVNEYEIQNIKPDFYCDSTTFTFDIVAVFEEKDTDKFYAKKFQEILHGNFAIKDTTPTPIENNRTQISITCVQNI